VNVLLMNVGHVLCGLPLSAVREVMRPLALERNQALPPCVLGICLIRQIPTPVVDLASLIGGRQGDPARFVTVTAETRQVALAVDAVLGSIWVDAGLFREAAPLVCGNVEAVAALAVLDQKLVYLLNSARLLPDATLESHATQHTAVPSEESRQ
jgi:purine-binding chemotaxis protein CheW